MTDYKELKECLVCGSLNLIPVVNIGMMPLVNNLKDTQTERPINYPLVVNECQECTHEQLTIAVDPKILFSDYLYQTGISNTHIKFFREFVQSLGTERKVLDIGCNDGSLLDIFRSLGWECTGVEPSDGLASRVAAMGIEVVNDFFPTSKLMGRHFNVITAFNVFAHNSNPKEFLREMKNLLTPGGSIYILTTPSRLDNYYHEHVSYFTPKSMMTLANLCGLEVSRFQSVSMHGNSYLFELENVVEPPRFDESIAQLNIPLVGYGASAGGIVLTNYFGLRLDYIVDDNPLKQGRFAPSLFDMNIPIVGNGHLCSDQRDLTIIVLAHHLFDEIIFKIKKMRPKRNDIFIHPIRGVIK